ncbi:ParB/RepB/Spo0J family partition protein [Desulfosarcina cetonica]|uniref:ParB/RepB/Spo0J family partition protein n=1 Tax=Desulfosarcina cetonica TaxID=90730 RepID=UPI0006CFEAD6|nr:ParB/RepB/Spo0J family partition protein [Desulfosarcina cetonica]
MAKDFSQDARDRSLFLVPSTLDTAANRGDRLDTRPLREARWIEIQRIQPDPNQPRKTFVQETLESLARSIREIGGIIDPITVQFSENEDGFLIISGERRYLAAKIAGLDTLPCIIKQPDDKTRFLMQFIANIQREDIPPLEEAAAIRRLVQTYGFTQHEIAKLINKSKSYVSQVLGLERLSDEAKKKVQTSELSKEVQIQASRETEPGKQIEILKMASDDKKTVRDIRNQSRQVGTQNSDHNETFSQWSWRSKKGRFTVSVRFMEKHPFENKANMVQAALNEAIGQIYSERIETGGELKEHEARTNENEK